MEKVQWKVEGMDCNTCAINIHRYLEKQGMKNVRVNFATGDVSFDTEGTVAEEKISKGIDDLGYKVADTAHDHAHGHSHDEKAGFASPCIHINFYAGGVRLAGANAHQF